MNSIKFYDGQPLEASHLNTASDYVYDAIKERYLDNYTYGVVVDKSPDAIAYTDGTTLGIYGVTAYDKSGNRIYIAPVPNDTYGNAVPALSGLLPDDNGLLIHGGNPLLNQTTYIMVLRYKETQGEPITHHVESGEPYLMGVISSYELYLRNSGEQQDGDILIANVAVDSYGNVTVDDSVKTISHVQDSAVVATVNSQNVGSVTDEDGTVKQYGYNISFEKHINSIGSGEVSEKNPHGLSATDLGIDTSATANHQKLLHVDGIRTDNIESMTSAMYPSYRRETASDYEMVYIQPLSLALNEIAIINGESITPRDFTSVYTYSFRQRASAGNLGYYIFSYNSTAKRIELSGPFESEEDPGFTQVLNTSTMFPICSLKWDYVQYDVTGDGEPDQSSYDIIPSTFKDRRIFNNTSLKNFRPDDAFALTQFAPVANDVAYIHNVQLISKNAYTKYNVAGKTLSMFIDGEANPVTVTFQGNSEAPLPVSEVINQLTSALAVYPSNGQAYLRAYPRVITSDGDNANAGKISISAPYSIVIDTASSAASVLGFTTANQNFTATSEGLVKEMIYYGERNGVIVFTYNDDEQVTQIDYYLGGGKVRRNKFTYLGGYIIRVEEIIEAL